MKSGFPPSSQPSALRLAALDAERGTLRETLAGLRNLVQLLQSLRVGPRPLSSVLPDVLQGCAPMRGAAGTILSTARVSLGALQAADELERFVLPRIDELDRALTEAMSRPLTAKSRLLLEESVSRLSSELDTARGLFDLFGDALGGRSMRLDVMELSRQSFSGPPSGGSWPGEMLVATLFSTAPGLELDVNPRVFTALLAFGVSLVSEAGRADLLPHIRVDATPDGGCQILIQRERDLRGEELMLLRRGIVAPTLSCITSVARASGATLDFDAQTRSFSLLFGRAFSPEQFAAG